MPLVIYRDLKLGDGTTADLATVTQPNRAPTVESELVVPAGIAMIGGLVLGSAATAAICVLWRAPWWPTLPIACAISAGVAWLAALSESRSTLWRTETVTVLGQQPQPDPPKPHDILYNPEDAKATVANIQSEQAQSDRFGELTDFIRRCAAVGTSESAQGIKPPDRAKYLANRDTLMGLGLAKWRNPGNTKAGWILTVQPAQARDVIRRHVISGV